MDQMIKASQDLEVPTCYLSNPTGEGNQQQLYDFVKPVRTLKTLSTSNFSQSFGKDFDTDSVKFQLGATSQSIFAPQLSTFPPLPSSVLRHRCP